MQIGFEQKSIRRMQKKVFKLQSFKYFFALNRKIILFVKTVTFFILLLK